MSYQTKIIKEMENKGYTVLKIVRLNKTGYPDLLCLKKDNPDVWIECKEKNDTLKELQKFRIDELIKLGKQAYCSQDTKGIIYPIITNSGHKNAF